MAEESSDEDEWGTEELILPTVSAASKAGDREISAEEMGDDDEWNAKATLKTEMASVKAQAASAEKDETSNSSKKPGEPMILVDLTLLSDGAVHCRHDPNAVNDPEAVSKWRKDIGRDYADFIKKSHLVANGTIFPCGSSVWKEALQRVRQDKPGHYFTPIFPPVGAVAK